MMLAPPLLSVTRPPFLVLAHIFVLANSHRPKLSHRRDLWPAFPAGDLGSEWKWTLASFYLQGPHHSYVLGCTACCSLMMRP
jgi:hypothetical protein